MHCTFLKYIDATKFCFFKQAFQLNKDINTCVIGMHSLRVNHYVLSSFVKDFVEKLKPDYILSIAPELLLSLKEEVLEKTVVIPQGGLRAYSYKM